MRKAYCDLCDEEIPAYKDPVRVEMRDGEHPHCRSTMTKTVDCCEHCLSRLKLYSKQEYSDVKGSLFTDKNLKHTEKTFTLSQVLYLIETEEELDGEIPESLKKLGEDADNLEELMRTAVRATKASLKRRLLTLS